MRPTKLWLNLAILVTTALGLHGCGNTAEEKLLTTLDTPPTSPEAWVELLEDARDILEEEEQDALAAEVGYLIRSARATISGASSCTLQQAEQRIRRVAEDIIDAQRSGDSAILPVEPLVCSVDPPRLAREENTMVWQEGRVSGYDFDRVHPTDGQMGLYLYAHSDIEGDDLQHIEWTPNTPSAFEATIDLWSVDQDLTDEAVYRHLELRWGGERLRTIYLAGTTMVDGEVPIPSDARLFSFLPTEQKGDDRDFDGECEISAEAKVMIKPSDSTKLVLQLEMEAIEIGRGTTEVSGTSDVDDPTLVVYEAEEGYEIDAILSDNTTDCIDYRDKSHDVDYPREPSVCSQSLVRQWRFLGDTDGDEAGIRTRVSVKLEDLAVQVVKLAED